MRIDQILKSVKQVNANEKTAQQNTAVTTPARSEKVAGSRDAALLTALDEAINSGSAKTAGENRSPVTDVMKVASEIAATEQEALVKEAQIFATAFADALAARMDTWNKVAAEQHAKHMAALEKRAAEVAAYVQQSATGYTDEATAKEAAYNEGWNTTVQAIHKTAAEEFKKAAYVTANILNAAVAQ